MENKQIKELQSRGGFCPIEIDDKEVKELRGHDEAALRYLAADYLKANEDALGLYDTNIAVFDENAYIEDNRLYVGNFDGYWFGNQDTTYTLRAFAFSKDEHLIAMIQDNCGNSSWYLMD